MDAPVGGDIRKLLRKSALVEALMGFQFNYMKYDAMGGEPRCYLITEDRPP